MARHTKGRLKRAQKRGITLLEVLLSLALTTVIMATIGMAIHLHMRAMTIERSHVEEAQLARAVLDLMAKDLRSALYMPSKDGGGTFASAEADAEDPSGESLSDDNLLSDAELGLVPIEPGIFGDLYQIQIDVGVLPKPEQYIAQLSSGDGRLLDRPSEMKTVAYYVQNADEGAEVDVTGATVGLVRRSLDRAVTVWAIENGGSQSLDMSGKIIAPEVVAVRFRYFDGYDWVEEWDSSYDGGIPTAVEIMLEIARSENDPDTIVSSSLLIGEVSNENTFTYRRVVHIPTSDPTSLTSGLDSGLSDSTGGASL